MVTWLIAHWYLSTQRVELRFGTYWALTLWPGRDRRSSPFLWGGRGKKKNVIGRVKAGLAGQYWFSIVSILAWWQVTILNLSTGLWWFANRVRRSCESAPWFGLLHIAVYIIFCQTSVSTFCRTRMSWAFPRGHDCFINSYQNLNYPFIAAAQHCCFFQHSFDYIL